MDAEEDSKSSIGDDSLSETLGVSTFKMSEVQMIDLSNTAVVDSLIRPCFVSADHTPEVINLLKVLSTVGSKESRKPANSVPATETSAVIPVKRPVRIKKPKVFPEDTISYAQRMKGHHKNVKAKQTSNKEPDKKVAKKNIQTFPSNKSHSHKSASRLTSAKHASKSSTPPSTPRTSRVSSLPARLQDCQLGPRPKENLNKIEYDNEVIPGGQAERFFAMLYPKTPETNTEQCELAAKVNQYFIEETRPTTSSSTSGNRRKSNYRRSKKDLKDESSYTVTGRMVDETGQVFYQYSWHDGYDNEEEIDDSNPNHFYNFDATDAENEMEKVLTTNENIEPQENPERSNVLVVTNKKSEQNEDLSITKTLF